MCKIIFYWNQKIILENLSKYTMYISRKKRYSKIANFSKLMYIFNSILVKIPAVCFW